MFGTLLVVDPINIRAKNPFNLNINFLITYVIIPIEILWYTCFEITVIFQDIILLTQDKKSYPSNYNNDL